VKQEISEGRITRPIRPAERNSDPIGTNLQTSWTGCSTTRRGFIDPGFTRSIIGRKWNTE
jgi:hypothetical protein